MKLFAALLAGSALIAVPAQAEVDIFNNSNSNNLAPTNSNNTTNKNNNSGDNRGNNYSGERVVNSTGVIQGNKNNVGTLAGANVGPLAGADVTNEGGKGGKGGKGGEGGDARAVIREGAVDTDVTTGNQRSVVRDSGNSSSSARGGDSRASARGGDQRQSQSSRSRSGVRNSGNSSNSNTNSSQSNNTNSTSSSSSADNNGNSQTLNYTNIDVPEATVAPTPGNGVPGQVGDVIVPLPSIVGGAFISEDDGVFGTNDRTTRGVTLGFQLPLGTAQVRRAAEQVIARRESAARFQLIQEATWMLQRGILREDVHPEHWAALYGEPEVVPVF